jgi:hypothetical protein
MSSDFVLSITKKDTPKQANPIHLVMWEGNDTTQELLDRISQLEKSLAKLMEEKTSSLFFPPALHPTPRGIEVKSRSHSFVNEIDNADVFKNLTKVDGPGDDFKLDTEDDDLVEADDSELEAELDALIEADAADADEDKAEADADEDKAEEAEEFQEITWKDKTYYKDSQNQVYELDTDGDLIDTPIGIWKEDTKKLVKYKTV